MESPRLPCTQRFEILEKILCLQVLSEFRQLQVRVLRQARGIQCGMGCVRVHKSQVCSHCDESPCEQTSSELVGGDQQGQKPFYLHRLGKVELDGRLTCIWRCFLWAGWRHCRKGWFLGGRPSGWLSGVSFHWLWPAVGKMNPRINADYSFCLSDGDAEHLKQGLLIILQWSCTARNSNWSNKPAVASSHKRTVQIKMFPSEKGKFSDQKRDSRRSLFSI